ncbi:MAG TPA: hypothetical protein VL524_02630 [Gemmatimonadaceae bacterium]|nr:hypothetical protein [Gemmatimonadaceae bacterium]
MYGLIVRLTVHDGKRDEMIDVLSGGPGDTLGCICYVVGMPELPAPRSRQS